MMSARLRDLSGRAFDEEAERARMSVACLLSGLRRGPTAYLFALS
jgi:hypothetical protein